MTAIDWDLAADLLAWSERLEETVITFEDFQKEGAEMEFYVRRGTVDPSEWVVWGPMGDPAFIGQYSGHRTESAAWGEARWRNDAWKRRPKPQVPACDNCAVGVMDATNPHLWGDCKCFCHATKEGESEQEAA